MPWSTPLQNGSFYETIGFDAVMMVEVCGLNPMAPDKGMAKAGLPIANVSKEIETLLHAGLEVVSGCGLGLWGG
jgi:DNA mismatch repair ATPase MutS